MPYACRVGRPGMLKIGHGVFSEARGPRKLGLILATVARR
jgi:hypothetical protein